MTESWKIIGGAILCLYMLVEGVHLQQNQQACFLQKCEQVWQPWHNHVPKGAGSWSHNQRIITLLLQCQAADSNPPIDGRQPSLSSLIMPPLPSGHHAASSQPNEWIWKLAYAALLHYKHSVSQPWGRHCVLFVDSSTLQCIQDLDCCPTLLSGPTSG